MPNSELYLHDFFFGVHVQYSPAMFISFTDILVLLQITSFTNYKLLFTNNQKNTNYMLSLAQLWFEKKPSIIVEAIPTRKRSLTLFNGRCLFDQTPSIFY